MTDESSAEALCWLRKIKVRQRCNHDARWHNGKGLVDGSEGEASLGMPPTTINALDRLFLIISNPPNGFECRKSAAFVAGHVCGVISGLNAMRACDDSQRTSQGTMPRLVVPIGVTTFAKRVPKLCGQEYGRFLVEVLGDGARGSGCASPSLG